MTRLAILCAITLAACAPLEPFTQAPTYQKVCVAVKWSSPAAIQQACRSGNVIACATIPPADMREPHAVIWTEKPASFDDRDRVCALGHEMLHALGANHERNTQ